MAIRCYYWNTRKKSIPIYLAYKLTRRYNGLQLKNGNPGDVFNKDLIKWIYNDKSLNIENQGKRLLMIGSVLAQVRQGDVLSGIGWKGNDVPINFNFLNECEILGLRGPMTLDYLKRNQVSVDNVNFLLDPGLLISSVYTLNLNQKPSLGKVIFIPHYREFIQHRVKKLPHGIKLCNIDKKPKELAEEILDSELIYSSSLHVLIFAHALNRPCIFVAPQTEEPIFKYQDYFASVDIPYQKPLSRIEDASPNQRLISPHFIQKSIADFQFPTISFLKSKGIVE